MGANKSWCFIKYSKPSKKSEEMKKIKEKMTAEGVGIEEITSV